METLHASAAHVPQWQMNLTPSIESFKHYTFDNPHKKAIWQLATLGTENMQDVSFAAHGRLRLFLFRLINKASFDIEKSIWATSRREWDAQLEMLKSNLEKMSNEQARMHMFGLRQGFLFH